MISRDELKTMIDALPDSSLEFVRTMLKHQLNPPVTPPEVVRMRARGDEFRKKVEAQFQSTRKPGTVSSMGGGGGFAMQNGRPFGRNSFHYWDGNALVCQTLQALDRQEIEIMERLEKLPDRQSLSVTLEISSGGRTLRLEELFPLDN